MDNMRFKKGCTAEQRVNSIKFEISLWEKVRLHLEEDGTKKVINASRTIQSFPY